MYIIAKEVAQYWKDRHLTSFVSFVAAAAIIKKHQGGEEKEILAELKSGKTFETKSCLYVRNDNRKEPS